MVLMRLSEPPSYKVNLSQRQHILNISQGAMALIFSSRNMASTIGGLEAIEGLNETQNGAILLQWGTGRKSRPSQHNWCEGFHQIQKLIQETLKQEEENITSSSTGKMPESNVMRLLAVWKNERFDLRYQCNP